MKEKSRELLHTLADGQPHSKKQLAEQSSLQSEEVPQALQVLSKQFNLDIQQIGTNYHLDTPLNLLNPSQILACLSQSQRAVLQHCTITLSTASTNTLAIQEPPPLKQAAAWLTEYQTAGRGRRGRQWIGSFARQLQFTLAYTFNLPIHQLSGLSIAVGAVLAKRLSQYAVPGLSLKWPNDIQCAGQKLAGILIEIPGNVNGQASAIIGVGLNLQPDAIIEQQVLQPSTNLYAQGIQPNRNQLAGEIIHDLIVLCQTFPTTGLTTYLELWKQYDRWQGSAVSLTGPQQQLHGHYIGLDDTGHLLLQMGDSIQRCHAGELSLRRNIP
jgi:BirA family biotin operon repressor/biotin-[acetyl-CoA-carboxylase] ligase